MGEHSCPSGPPGCPVHWWCNPRSRSRVGAASWDLRFRFGTVHPRRFPLPGRRPDGCFLERPSLNIGDGLRRLTSCFHLLPETLHLSPISHQPPPSSPFVFSFPLSFSLSLYINLVYFIRRLYCHHLKNKTQTTKILFSLRLFVFVYVLYSLSRATSASNHLLVK